MKNSYKEIWLNYFTKAAMKQMSHLTQHTVSYFAPFWAILGGLKKWKRPKSVQKKAPKDKEVFRKVHA